MNLDNDEFKILKNMNEISAKENMISTLRIRIEELTKKKEEYKNFRKKYIPYNVYAVITTSIVATPIIIACLTQSNPFLVTSTFYQYDINLALTTTLFSMGISLPTVLPIEFKSYEYHKKKQKEIKSIESELDKLEEELQLQRQQLTHLKRKQILIIKLKMLKELLELNKQDKFEYSQIYSTNDIKECEKLSLIKRSY